MVSTWMVIILAIGIALVSFTIPWAEVVSSNGNVEANLTPSDLASAVGDQYDPCSCPPWASLPENASQGTPFDAVQAVTLEAIVPALVSVTFIAAGAWIFPLVFLLACLSLFRLKAMVLSGTMFVAASASWVVGIDAEAKHVNAILARWAGQGPAYLPPIISTSFGPYVAALSGIMLIAGYALIRLDVVERPLD